MFGNLAAGEISVQPKGFHESVISWTGGVATGRWARARGGGSGVWEGPQAPDFILNQGGRNQSLSDEQSQVVQVWPPREVGNEEWLGIPTWRPGDSSRTSPWRILTLLEPPLSLFLTRFGLVCVGFYFWAEPAPGRWRQPHDGKQGVGRKFFSVCFEQRSEIIAALLLFCQSCLRFVAVNSPMFILSGFLSDVDLRAISSWHLLISDSTTDINPAFLLPPWSLSMLLNPRSMGTANSCPQPCPQPVLALTEG